MTKFTDRLKENIDKWFELRETMTKCDYKYIKDITWKVENVK